MVFKEFKGKILLLRTGYIF